MVKRGRNGVGRAGSVLPPRLWLSGLQLLGLWLGAGAQVSLTGSTDYCYNAARPDTTDIWNAALDGNQRRLHNEGECVCPLDPHLQGLLNFQGKTLVCDYRCYDDTDPYGRQECGYFSTVHPQECRACSLDGCEGAVAQSCVPCQDYCAFYDEEGCKSGSCTISDQDLEFLASLGVRVLCDEACIVDDSQPGCNFWDLGKKCRGCQVAPCGGLEGCYQCPAEDTVCSAKFEQCGGGDWAGANCCQEGLVCNVIDDSYSQCLSSGRDCSAEKQQCGGASWDGPTCCDAGLVCNYWNQHFSQCLQPEDACVPMGDQCGGAEYIGPRCCQGGQVCNFWDATYSSCVPPEECGADQDQCGGNEWVGATCCQSGQECKVWNEYYSQCVIREDPCPLKFEQCGGAFYTGQECCSSGLECYYWDQYYSQCLPPQPTPAPTPTGCQPVFQQCGGSYYDGPTCCDKGLDCYVWDEFYSQCLEGVAPSPAPTALPECPAVDEQCGGVYYTGLQCCQKGLVCFQWNEYYSQCLPQGSTVPTPAPSPSQQPTPVPTSTTPVPSVAPTPSPSFSTPEPSAPQPTASPAPTSTPEPSAPQPTASPAPTSTPGPSAPQPTASPAPTSTPEPSAPQPTASPAPTSTPEPSAPQPTASPAPTSTLEPSAPQPTASPTPTSTPAPSDQQPTASPAPTATPTRPTASPMPTNTPSPSVQQPTASPAPTSITPAPSDLQPTSSPAPSNTPQPTSGTCVPLNINCFPLLGQTCCPGTSCIMNVCVVTPPPVPTPSPTPAPTGGEACSEEGQTCGQASCCGDLVCVDQNGERNCADPSKATTMKVNYEISAFPSNICGDALEGSRNGTVANTLCANSCVVGDAAVVSCSPAGFTARRLQTNVVPRQCSTDPTAACDLVVEVAMAFFPGKDETGAEFAASGLNSFALLSNFNQFSESVGVSTSNVAASNIAYTAGDIEVVNDSSQNVAQGQTALGNITENLYWAIIVVAVVLLLLWAGCAYAARRDYKGEPLLGNWEEKEDPEKREVEAEVEAYISKLMSERDMGSSSANSGQQIFDEYALPYHDERGVPLAAREPDQDGVGSDIWSAGSGHSGGATSPNEIFPEMTLQRGQESSGTRTLHSFRS